MKILKDTSGFLSGIFFSLNRRMILKQIGKELLGEKYYHFAVLEMRDVTISSSWINGFFTDRMAGIVFGPFWGFFNWIAAVRAYMALESNRDLPVRIVFMTLICKDAPKEVWDEFYRRNPEAMKYKTQKGPFRLTNV